MDLFGVSGYTKCSLGITKLRKTELADITNLQKRKLLRLFQKIVLKEAHAFLPKEPENLVMEVMKEFVTEGILENGFLKGLMACKKVSVEKRLLRALVLGCVEGEEGKMILHET